MVSFFKSLQSVFSGILADMPEGLKVVTEFIWKCRWFIVGAFVLIGVYQLVMVVLPFLLWTWVIKATIGSIFSIFSIL
jgi:hypothetical protein